MRVIPVIDLKAGLVVRAVAGRRDEYRPISSRLVRSAVPADVARALMESFATREFYVADLDAISGAPQAQETYGAILSLASEVCIDAGLSSPERIAQLVAYANTQPRLTGIVVGLESVSSAQELPAAVAAIGVRRAIFSLDLMAGKPWTDSDEWSGSMPLDVVDRVVASGFRRLIVLDLSDVGGQGGTSTLSLCQRIRGRFPDLELVAGGGVRGPDDLKRLEAAGCHGALVASALHDGRLCATDLGV